MTKTRTALLALTAIAGLAAGGAASAETTPLPARQVALGADHFHARAHVVDDPLDIETVISSERGFQTGKGLFRAPSNDNHLRAVVDKRSGATRFEVRQVLTYMGPVRGYGEVAYETGQWPVRAPVTRIKDNAGYCFVFEAPELCREEVAFEISESELRRAAAQPGAWRFKFKSDGGDEHRTAITHAEIEGLLKAVDGYRRTLPAVQAEADTAADG
ncbi:hypothetical protein ASD89_23935 [Caulobacter sp. Root656]|uniref:Secreted protein n=1 Tax=Caulobacter rhizosphaerae TaxID=2010972 RepID=A0ABU1MUP6_9CAUL|nr:hypothetical protein [Caulobacter rhizosphaerae]KRA62140.1 hypothetical protein ASD89_23935 [Caulobacter sp. Root656]MDR6529894.1 hypothetical protein [Caulobacter rhizosphaerae]